MSLLHFFSFRGRRRAQKLYERGRKLVDSGDYDGALVVGRKLRKLRYSGAYEIEGLAYQALDRNEDAVRVLREGVAIAPGVWLNWLLLGSCLSNLGRYDEALLAYDRALECDGADASIVHLNRAVVSLRQGAPERALALLEQVEGRPYEAAGVRVSALRALGRDHEAEHTAMRVLAEWRSSDRSAAKRDAGEIACLLGEIRLARGDDPAAVRALAIDVWRDTHRENLLWLIRQAPPKISPAAQYFRLRIVGTFAPGTFEGLDDADAFLTSADVVADSAEEALAFVLELRPPEPGVTVAIESADALEPRPGEPKGVYTAIGRVFYPTRSK